MLDRLQVDGLQVRKLTYQTLKGSVGTEDVQHPHASGLDREVSSDKLNIDLEASYSPVDMGEESLGQSRKLQLASPF